MEPVLKTTDLTKRYREKLAVNRVSMTVERGDIYGFIGKNGAGKTTLMKMVLGLTTPTEGQIELFGGENPEQARKKIGSLIENPGLYPGCSAYENLRRFALLSGGTEEEIREILRLVELDHTGNKKAGKFSLGMRQRLGIAIALLGNPDFMILDEPINGLDPEGIKSVRDVILRLNKERGVTFLISSHLIDELAKIVTRYGIIKDGILVEEITEKAFSSRAADGLKIGTPTPDKAAAQLYGRLPKEDIIVGKEDVFVKNATKYASKINALLVLRGIEVTELTSVRSDAEAYFIEKME